MEQYDYIVNAFTKEGDNTNLEVNNLNVGCISSKDNKFELDSNGNLTVNSLTVNDMRIATQLVLDVMYPVGSVYISVNDISPSAYFGGQWEQIKDTFLLGCGEKYENGKVGGEAEHKLTVTEMPSHSHQLYLNYDQGNVTIPAWGVKYSFIQPQSPTMGLSTAPAQTGGNQAHNNMPPYLAVYMWKRVG